MINLIGQSLQNGKYYLKQELGRGRFGITYQATNLALEQEVAIKILAPWWRQDSNLAQSVERFQNEAKRLAKCSHPNIVRVLDFFVENGYPYIVMDYIRGQTLAQIVSNGNLLTETTAIEYIKQAGEALSAVHDQALLLHQDLKPKNLILSQDNQQVILIDFGIARELNSEKLHNQKNLLSEGYAPIEQYLIDSPRTIATDIYGLAATLYTLLTGKTPPSAISRVHGCILEPPCQIRPELSQTVSEAVMWGMALEADSRPSCVSEWLAQLTTDFNKTSIPVKSTSSKLVNPILGTALFCNFGTYRRKIALLTGTAVFGLGILLTVMFTNESFQVRKIINNNSSLANESSRVKSSSSQSPSIPSQKLVPEQKLPVNLVSSSESNPRSEPQTNLALVESESKIDKQSNAQYQAAKSVSLKQENPAPKPIPSSATPQLFVNTKTSVKSKPAIFSSGKTNPSIQTQRAKPQIFSTSSSVRVTNKQPAIFKNPKELKRVQKIKPLKKSKSIDRGRAKVRVTRSKVK
ncbi:serine/threonine protein kinase [Stanieria cyanosphaera PCC 7437]|uniref:Serine/threonine protein kinase n=1 Tax=Stanieria cyanosphaera (strain ATCC 29371 / PCC 7437) TaxID=111780 RepID=K9XY59_STAC7|nr:serine/threonine-protein kinase [Stanieria cyanosphaera]AFZ36572.1 serine/threonine protein kinase [Stanieria cyanosphaera PCC 7437]